MEQLKLKHGHVIEINTDHECLTSDCFSKFNKYLLLDNSFGSSVEEITSKHLSPLYSFIKNDKKEEAFDQINNLRQAFHLMLNEINVSTMAFCCLVQSIDGRQVTDYSESSLKEMSVTLGKMGLTQDVIKKKAKTPSNTSSIK